MSSHNGSKTRKGVHANHPGVKLVNVTNGEVVERVSRTVAAQRITAERITAGWRYCPKKFKI